MTDYTTIASPNGAFEMRLHNSLWHGLTGASGICADCQTISTAETDLLKSFAETCENPSGQKADLARSIAALAHVAGGSLNVARSTPAPTTFWATV